MTDQLPLLAFFSFILLSLRLTNQLNDLYNSCINSNAGKMLLYGTSDFLNYVNNHCDYIEPTNDITGLVIRIITPRIDENISWSNIYKNAQKTNYCMTSHTLVQRYINDLLLKNTQKTIELYGQELLHIYCEYNDCRIDTNSSNTSPHKFEEIKELILYNSKLENNKISDTEIVLFDNKISQPLKTLKSTDDVEKIIGSIRNNLKKSSEFIETPTIKIEMPPTFYSLITETISEFTIDKSFEFIKNYITGKDSLAPVTDKLNKMDYMLENLQNKIRALTDQTYTEIRLTKREVEIIVLKFYVLSNEIKWYAGMTAVLLPYFVSNNIFIRPIKSKWSLSFYNNLR